VPLAYRDGATILMLQILVTGAVASPENAKLGVTWVHSYVSTDKGVTYCVYDGPSPAAIRQAAEASGLPADQITEVSVLDPYFYH